MAWTHEQEHNARIIIQVGNQLGASQRDIQIALMVALTESNLRNVNYGDRDSLGVFQQRAAWGSAEQRTNVAESAKMFFTGGHAGQRGLFDFSNRASMSMGEAAQAVQVSAFPDRYAEHTHEAASFLHGNQGPAVGTGGILGGLATITNTVQDAVGTATEATDPTNPVSQTVFDSAAPKPDYLTPAVAQTATSAAGIGSATTALGIPNDNAFTFPTNTDGSLDLSSVGGGSAPMPGGAAGEAWRQQIRKIAKRYLGTPYVWGGTSPSGFDCSGFVQYVYKQMGINLPRISADQARSGKRIGLDNLRVGDLVGFDNSSRNNGADHIAIYIGNGMIIEAPRPGLSVQVSHLYDQEEAWGVRMNDG